MAKKVREQAIALSSYLKSVNSEDISENQDVQRMFCWDNGAINELIYTVLNEDYIPPIILGEEELGDNLTQQYIVDGIQRTTALNKFRHMNWKTTKSFENSVIQYQKKRRDEKGHLIKDENGNLVQHGHEHTPEHSHEHTHADGVTHTHSHVHGDGEHAHSHGDC